MPVSLLNLRKTTASTATKNKLNNSGDSTRLCRSPCSTSTQSEQTPSSGRGLVLKRCSRLAVFTIQQVGLDAAAVWLFEDVIRQTRLFRAPIWCPSGGGGTRKAGEPFRGKPSREQQHAQAYRATRYRASKHQIRRGRRAARSSTSHGNGEPLCARAKGANREICEGKADLGPRSV